jgi:hypothetical protein
MFAQKNQAAQRLFTAVRNLSLSARTGALLVVAAFLSLSGPVTATPLTYFGEDLGRGERIPLTSFPHSVVARTSFLAGLIGAGTETFEGISVGRGAPLTLGFPGTFAPMTATLSGNGVIASVTPGTTNGVGRYATSGSRYWESSNVFNIDFSRPVSAFGFNGIDIGDFGGRVTATTAGGLNQVFNIPNTVNGAGGGVLFWGIIDPTTTFTKVSFGNTAPGTDFFGFDDMTVGDIGQVRQNVPAPQLGPTTSLGSKDFLFPLGGDKAVYLTTEALTGHSKVTTGTPYYDEFHDKVYALDLASERATIVAAKTGVIVDDGKQAIDENGRKLYKDENGKLVTTDNGNPYTNGQIIIRHSGGYFTVYGDPNAHPILGSLKSGDTVQAGDPLASLNNLKDHLHFQVRYDPGGNGLSKGLSDISIEALKGITVGGKAMADYKLNTSTTEK